MLLKPRTMKWGSEEGQRVLPRGLAGYLVEGSPFWAGLLVLWVVIVEIASVIGALSPGSMAISVKIRQLPSGLPLEGITSDMWRVQYSWEHPDAVSAWLNAGSSVVVGTAVVAAYWAYRGFLAEVFRGEPFGSAFPRFSRAAVIAALVGGYLPPVLNSIVALRFISVYQLRATEAFNGELARNATLNSALGSHTTLLERFRLTPTLFPDIDLPFWPLGVLVAAVLLNAVFSYGKKLEAETEGLV